MVRSQNQVTSRVSFSFSTRNDLRKHFLLQFVNPFLFFRFHPTKITTHRDPHHRSVRPSEAITCHHVIRDCIKQNDRDSSCKRFLFLATFLGKIKCLVSYYIFWNIFHSKKNMFLFVGLSLRVFSWMTLFFLYPFISTRFFHQVGIPWKSPLARPGPVMFGENSKKWSSEWFSTVVSTVRTSEKQLEFFKTCFKLVFQNSSKTIKIVGLWMALGILDILLHRWSNFFPSVWRPSATTNMAVICKPCGSPFDAQMCFGFGCGLAKSAKV